jgi:hypothetical protein
VAELENLVGLFAEQHVDEVGDAEALAGAVDAPLLPVSLCCVQLSHP